MVSLRRKVMEPRALETTEMARKARDDPAESRSGDSDPDETEDEEVKLNCIAGHRGLQDSDFSSGDDDDDDNSSDSRKEDDDGKEEEKRDGVVEFVAVKLQESSGGLLIRRPKPIISGAIRRLSPHQEEQSSDGSRESSEGGVAMSNDETSSKVDEDSSVDRSENETPQGSSSDATAEGTEPTSDIFSKKQGPFEALGSQNQKPAKTKRVLSSNTLDQLNLETIHLSASPKKMRSSPDENEPRYSPPEFSLGPCATSNTPHQLQFRPIARESPEYLTDDEDLDARLTIELEPDASDSCHNNSPVPLLTPPQSPLTVEMNGDVASICEWPSNLVIDSALMTAATETRPLSPASLQDYDLTEEQRRAVVKEPSCLTPLLKSIQVGTD